MAKSFTRKEIQDDFRAKIKRKEPLIATSAGSGLVAKMQDIGGSDLIMAYNTGVFRMDGAHGTYGLVPYGDGNTMTLELARRFMPRVNNTPMIAGIGAADPYRNIDTLIDEMVEMGFSGVTNVPCSASPDQRVEDMRDAAGLGFNQELKLIELCNKKDVFTVVYAFTEKQIREAVQAGADVVSAHAGQTAGGLLGAENVMDIDRACEMTQKLYEAAIEENPNVFVFCHGGPFWNPENTQYAFDHTDVHGFIGASCMERIPVEEAIGNIVTEFLNLKLR